MNFVLNTLKHQAKTQPNALAIQTDHETVSYACLHSRVQALATEFNKLNIPCVGLYMPNSIEWVIADLAAWTAGMTIVPIPGYFSRNQIAHLLEDAAVDTILCNPSREQLFAHGRERILKSEHICLQQRPLQPHVEREGCTTAKITYTSGSTGAAKGVCLHTSDIERVVQSLLEVRAGGGTGIHLCLLPFSILLENIAGIYLPLCAAGSLLICNGEELGFNSNSAFQADRFIQALAPRNIASVILFPQMLKDLAFASFTDELTSLQFVAVGGGSVAPSLITQAHNRGLPVYEGYGLSECASVVCLNTPKALRAGSVGRPLPHAEVTVSHEGEIIVRGASMQGYLGGTRAPKTWHTGDLGHIDAEGYVYITGRKKNGIISSFGRNISPEWVESMFMAHPLIKQLSIYGEGEPTLSAVIVAAESVEHQAVDEVVRAVNQTLPDYARIHHWVIAPNPFSSADGTLTQNGKLQRQQIFSQYHKQLSERCKTR